VGRSLRDFRLKIKGVKSTRQVTKAMEMVSASKMRKAIQSTVMLRQYATAAWNILQRIAALQPEKHPYLQERPIKKVLCILFTSDRGLCGNLNTQLFRMVQQYVQTLKGMPTFESIDFIAIGKKGQQFLSRTNHNVIAAFNAPVSYPTMRDMAPVMRMATEGFTNGTYDHVSVLYADFISALSQVASLRVLLPLSETELHSMMESMLPRTMKQAVKDTAIAPSEFKFEPSPREVLDTILPRLTEIQIYQASLEASASEHSARMMAMHNASDNASDLLADLNLTYNQTRQAKITAELAELSASKAALD